MTDRQSTSIHFDPAMSRRGGSGATRSRRMLPAVLLLLLGACGGGGGGSGGDGGPDTKTGGDTGTDPGPSPGSTDAGSVPGGTDGTLVDKTPEHPVGRGLLPKLALADHVFESDHFAGSENCAACHNNEAMSITTEAGAHDVSIGKAWETSTMANAARDPYWHAVVAYELDRFPAHEEEINDTCTRCHAPMANEYAKKEGLALRVFDEDSEEGGERGRGIYSMSKEDDLFNHAMDGVSCTLCHQIDPDNLGIGSVMPESSMTGGYEIVDYSDGDIKDRPAYGQYADPDASYMRQQVGFLAQKGAHLSRSETCATCHNLNVASLDTEGVPLENAAHFAEQANYTEWLFSDYADGKPLEASCQSCHMPKLEQPVVIAEGTSLSPRDDFAEHTFLGANTVMQRMMRDFAGELGVQPGLDFDASIARNRAFLNTAATVSIRNASLGAGETPTLAFDVNVVNESGHKLPSGYHSRRVWLQVLITNADGEAVFESGVLKPNGSITGVAEDVDPATWEPHHDVITNARQVQVYQAIVGNSDGKRTHSLLNGSQYLKDNRLTPKGFAKEAVTGSPDVLPSFGVFGAAMADEDFDSGKDTVSYRLPMPEPGPYNVRITLKYQPLSFGHLDDLFRTSGDLDPVDMFNTIYKATDVKAEVIATVTTAVN